MKVNTSLSQSEEWLKILDKGMITLPKPWREKLGLKKGSVMKAKKQGTSIILEPLAEEVPFRLYTDAEINEFMKEDSVPITLKAKSQKKLSQQ